MSFSCWNTLSIKRAPHSLILCFLLLLSGCEHSIDKPVNADYFEQLRTQKLESSSLVEWKNVGPGLSGYNEKLWTHPDNSNVMFMAPDMHVAYGSWDGGQSWNSIQDHDSLGQQMKRVIDLEFSKQNPNYAMALDWNGWVYESKDQGKRWHKLSELSPSYQSAGINPYDPLAFKKGWYDEQIGKRLNELAVDPNNDKVWYVGAGDFFNVKENHRSRARPQGNILSYADYGYIVKTSDRGRSWQKIKANFPADLDVGKIVVSPLNSNELVMATNHGVMKSVDGGLNWQPSATGLANNLPRDLYSHFEQGKQEWTLYTVDQTVYHEAGTSVRSIGGVFKSTDGGNSWQNISGNLAINLQRIHYPEEIKRYYRTISHWFGITREQAKQRFPELPKSILPVFNRVAVNPNDNDEIYLTYNKKHDRTFGPGEVWQSLDGGNTWKVVARHGHYWLNNPDQDYWAERNNPTDANVEFSHVQAYMNVHAEKEGNRLLTINKQGDLFISVAQQTQRSTDKGKTWQQIDDFETSPGSDVWVGRGNSDLPGRFMLLDTGIAERRLFASGEHGVWQSTALGEWGQKHYAPMKQIEGQTNIDGMVSIGAMAVHPQDPNVIFITSWRQDHRGKLRKSVDGGKTWGNIATLFELPDGQQSKASGKVIQGPPNMMPAHNSLLIDPKEPNNMYLAVTKDAFSEIYRAPRRQPVKGGYGFMRSKDGGHTWEVSNNGFHSSFSLRRIVLHPNNPNHLYAATSDENGGLYFSKDQGSHWQRVELPEVIKSVNNIFIDENTSELYLSAGGFYNGNYEEGGAWVSADNGQSWRLIFKAPAVLQVESSPIDSKILVLTVANQMRMDRQFMNPGVYLSLDKGKSWNKVNRNLGNHDKIIDAKPDPHNKNLIWAAAWGSGWFVGQITP